MAVTLHDLLKRMVEMEGTDLHLTTGQHPVARVHGKLVPITEFPKMTPVDTKRLCYSVLTDSQKKRLEENLELDFSFGIKNIGRFRANVYYQRGAIAGAFRLIPHEIRNFSQLGIPPIVETLCNKPRGLVLVTGPTGSGKSTTLAAMIDKINKERPVHIVTIEDPIEYIHHHQRALVNQREIHADTHSFANALRSVLRQDPDVVLVGELRDLETIEMALRVAETGHLTFGTLHTNSAAETIHRIVDVFPSHQQPQVRAQLALILQGILCQALLPRADGRGRVLAMEILIPTKAIRHLIREDKIHQIYGAMQTGQVQHGMMTMNQSLAQLYLQRKITLETALSVSSDPDELTELINRRGVAPSAGRPTRR